MLNRILVPAFAAVMTAGLAISSALAQQQRPSVQIEGNTQQAVQAGSVTTSAVGVDNVAESNVGAIGAGSDVTIKGNTQQSVQVDSVTTTAAGVRNCAKANVGVIGGTSC